MNARATAFPAPAWPRRRVLIVLALAITIVLTSWLALAGRARPRALLVFEKSESHHTAKASDTVIVARFPFRNDEDKPIRILAVKTDCDCTVASLGKDVFAPGERGEINVTFTIGVRSGLQRKGVVVQTDHPAQRYVPLSLIVSIPEVLTLPTSVLLWTADESAGPKSLVVRTSEDPPVRKVVARGDSPFLAVAVERVAATEYRVQVTPAQDRRNITATVQIEAILDDGDRKQVSAFVRVR